MKIGFNSYQESGKLAKPIKESILVSSKNKSEVLFVKEGPYWEGTTLHFSASNASVFYSLVQKKLIDWTIFSSGVLSRFDLYYSRTKKIKDKISVRDFLENCQRKLKQTNKNVSFEKNPKGLILRIGSRRSNNYSRIYKMKNSLKFEHEMKGKFIQNYHLLLVSNNLEKFELSQEYKEYQQNFNSPSLSKRFDTKKYDEKRFKELAKDPKANKEVFHKTTVDEARSARHAEIEGIIENVSRLYCKSVDLDFKVDGPVP